MLRKKDVFFSFFDPEVLEERNKRIAEKIGKEFGYSSERVRDLYSAISALKDIIPQRLLEYLYEKFRTVKPSLNREGIQKIITTCHEEAFGWLQNTHQDLRDG